MLRLSLSFVAFASLAHAIHNGRTHPNFPPTPAVPIISPPDGPVISPIGIELPPLDTVYTFDQLIDHDNPSMGTFEQRFWTTAQFYQQGGPVILFAPGEANADQYTGYLTNRTIVGLIAQANNGTTVVLEHRFFGLSNPISSLDDDSLRLLTIDQSVKDLTYFAKNVKLPQSNGDQLSPEQAPWILVGGSYSGALTSWTMVDQPGVFWAGYASSAVVEAITDYWGYFEPIRQNMPKNCSADIEAVIAHIDFIFSFGLKDEQDEIKNLFGMGDMTHLDDVAGSLRNILWDWQSLQPYVGPGATFFKSCDALEVKNGVNAPTTGWGLEHALTAWGNYFANTYLPAICRDTDAEDCLGTYNTSQSFWTDTSINNARRSWTWSTCNELGFLQDSAPLFWPTLVTRLVQPRYDERQCSQMFPKAFPAPQAPRTASTNAKFKGWNVEVDRLFFANGKPYWFRFPEDPWREATVSSDFHLRQSSPSQPIYVSNGFHASDLITRANVDPTVKAVQDAGVATISKWILEFQDAQSSPSSLKAIPSPSPFLGVSIPASIVTASPAAVPSLATQAPVPHPVTTGKPRFAIPDAMVRQPVQV